MGRASRRRPARLAEKLLQVRTALSLSQNGLIMRLGLTDELDQSDISAYERGVREPSLGALLAYAQACGGGEYLEVLIDDRLNLPERLPSAPDIKEIRRAAAIKTKPKQRRGKHST